MNRSLHTKPIWLTIAGAACLLMVLCNFCMWMFGPSKARPAMTEDENTGARCRRTVHECKSFIKQHGRWPMDLQELDGTSFCCP
jgi:hypothetical protein